MNVSLPINLEVAKDAVISYMGSGKYDDDMNALTETWWAYFSKRPAGLNDMVIFDIDDTVLSSYDCPRYINVF